MRVVLLAVLLAGCASVAPVEQVASDDAADLPRFDIIETQASGCRTTAVFFLVDPVVAYQHLPLGFTPRDLSGFLYDFSPVTAGKIPIYVATSTCDTFVMDDVQAGVTHESSLELAYVGVYVEAPPTASTFADAEADHHFYSIAYIAPEQGESDAHLPIAVTKPVGWTWIPGRVDVDVVDRAPSGSTEMCAQAQHPALPDRCDALHSTGAITLNGSTAFDFATEAFFPQSFDRAPLLRFWQAAEHGLGFMEFKLPQKTVAAGPLTTCEVDPDSFIAEVIGPRSPAGPCNLVDSFALVFDDHELTGSLRHLEGVHLA